MLMAAFIWSIEGCGGTPPAPPLAAAQGLLDARGLARLLFPPIMAANGLGGAPEDD